MFDVRCSVSDILLFIAGFLLPYALMCLLLWCAGAFSQFVFWTISYAGKYAAEGPPVIGAEFWRATLDAVVGPNLLLWIVPWAGALLLWWEQRFTADHRFFLAALLFCSLVSVSVGLYFRPHYFITLLPVMALLTGVAVSRSLRLLKHDKTIELFLALPILGLFLIGALAALIGNGSVWFGAGPAQAIRDVYQNTLFSQALKAADYLKANTTKTTRVAVLGSEPEIYFYARRRSATGYIYMYPLMEKHPYAMKMQEQMIEEIERHRPEYVVYVDDNFSWLESPQSNRKVLDWWKEYWAANLDLVKTMDFREGPEPTSNAREASAGLAGLKHLLIFKRKQEPGDGR